MSYATEIASYLTTGSTYYVTGGSTGSGIPIWISKFPAESSPTAVAIFESGGPAPLYTHAGDVTIERPTIQVISRSTSYVTARNNAQDIYTTLASLTNTSIAKTTSTGETSYMTITPLQSPTDMGQDAEERAMITCNYMAEKEPS